MSSKSINGFSCSPKNYHDDLICRPPAKNDLQIRINKMVKKELAIATRYYHAVDMLTEEQLDRINDSLIQAYYGIERRIRYYVNKTGTDEAIRIELRRLTQVRAFYALSKPSNESIGLNTPGIDLNSLGGAVKRLYEIITPELASDIDDRFKNLLINTQHIGGLLADELLKAHDVPSRAEEFGYANIEAAAAQARDGLQRLKNHSRIFADSASRAVEVGLLQGLGAAQIALNMQRSLGILKTRAETIARTETSSALVAAGIKQYQRAGISYGQVFVTFSDDLCQFCAARNGNVYNLLDCRVPWHPRCRCLVVPYSFDWGDDTAETLNFVRKIIAQAPEINEGQAPFEKMEGRPAPIPVWRALDYA